MNQTQTNSSKKYNFTINELTKSSTAKRLSIDNTPNLEIKNNLWRLIKEVLQPIRDKWGQPIIVTSGYRCERLNKAIGGSLNSDHVYGAAADIKTVSDTREDNKRLFDLIVQMSKDKEIVCRQIIDEYNLDWIHLGINNKYNKYKENQILHIK